MSTSISSNVFSAKSPIQVWRITRREIAARKGGVAAFNHQGYSLSYSGPDVAVSPERDVFIPCLPRIDNLDRTDWMVRELLKQGIPVVWLDGSPIGKFIFVENQLYKGLREYYASIGITDRDTIRGGGDYVMSRVSRAYIKSAYGYAATAVCGASPKRIFRRYEMTPLINNPKILAVDELPRQMAQEFSAVNKDEAFQLLCWAEVLLSKYRLDMYGTDDDNRDFLQRQYYLSGERKLMASRITPLSKRWENKREEKRYEIFEKYAPVITHDALKDIITDIRPLCPTVVSFPSHVGKRAFARI